MNLREKCFLNTQDTQAEVKKYEKGKIEAKAKMNAELPLKRKQIVKGHKTGNFS